MKKLLSFLLSFLIIFTSCSKKAQSDGFKLFYYAGQDDKSIVYETIDFPDFSKNEIIKNLYLQLSNPAEKQHLAIIPQSVSLVDHNISNDICTVTLSSEYIYLDIIDKSAINACLTKTFCQLPYIDSVVIKSKDYSETFTEKDFVTDIPQLRHDTYTVNLYFANQDFNDLASESQIISLTPDENLESVVFSHLIAGPTKLGMQETIPEGTQLNSIFVNEGVCYIDLSAEFVENAIHDENHERVIIYSIVNTITELPMINSVKLSIDGNIGYGYVHHKISAPIAHSSQSKD